MVATDEMEHYAALVRHQGHQVRLSAPQRPGQTAAATL